jgi:hypothetical protein
MLHRLTPSWLNSERFTRGSLSRRLPELSNFVSPPAKPGAYAWELGGKFERMGDRVEYPGGL